MPSKNDSSSATENDRSASTTHEVDISWGTERHPEGPGEDQIRQWLVQSLNTLQQPASSVSVRVVPTEEMTALNHQYREKSEPTNVLSFEDGLTDEDGRVFLGDIVLCHHVVYEESQQYRKSLLSRYAHMLIHGLLHLLGYDHVRDDDRTRMESVETELMQRQGFDDPYEVAEHG